MTQQKPIDRRATRRERRAAARSSESRTGRPPVSAASGRRSPLRSPIALFTGGALLVGIVVIGVALATTGQLGDQSVPKAPLSAIPAKELWNGRALGKDDAPLKIEVFEDFQCPNCGVFSRNMQGQIVDDYVATGKAQFVFKDFVVVDRGGSTESLRAAVGARCAGEQGLFWPYHEWLYANQKGENEGHFSDGFLRAIAEQVGADPEAWAACTKTQAQADAVEAEGKEAVSRGAGGTPTMFVNGQQIQLTGYQEVRSQLDAILAAK